MPWPRAEMELPYPELPRICLRPVLPVMQDWLPQPHLGLPYIIPELLCHMSTMSRTACGRIIPGTLHALCHTPLSHCPLAAALVPMDQLHPQDLYGPSGSWHLAGCRVHQKGGWFENPKI